MARHRWARSDKYPEAMTAVYRLFDAAGRLLYVGIGSNYLARWKAHAKKAWWPQVARKEVIWHSSRLEAAWEESRAIETEGPVHNNYPGLDPVSLIVILVRVGWQRAWACPARPKMTTNQWERDDVVEAVISNQAHALVAVEGEIVGAVIPWEWYKAACAAMGDFEPERMETELAATEAARRAAERERRAALRAARKS